MNAKRFLWPAVLGVAVGITPAALAQQQEQETARQPQQQRQQTQQQQRQQQDQHRQLQNAHAMIGTNVTNPQGENLGSVEDIVLDRNHERVSYVVVSFGGLAGLGQKYFAVPLEAFQADPREKSLILNVDRRTFQEQPGFDRNNWPEQANPMFLPPEARQQQQQRFQQEQQRQQQTQQWDRPQQRRDGAAPEADRFQDQRYRDQDQRFQQDRQFEDQRYQDQRRDPRDQQGQTGDYYRDFRSRDDRAADRQTGDRWSDDRMTPDRGQERAAERRDGAWGTQRADERREGQWGAQQRDTRADERTTRFGRGTDWAWGTGERPEGAPEAETFWMRRVTRLTGTNVINLQNQNLGQIEDLIIDTQDGSIAYATVSYGGVLGIGESQATVPWVALNMDAQRNRVVLETQRETLEGLAFREPTTIDDAYARELHQQFEREPYWQALGFENGRADAAWRADSTYNRMFDAQKVQTVEGTIQSIGSFRPQANASPGVRVRLTTQEGQAVIVHMGPERHLQQQNIRLRVGERISVTGSPAEVQGRSVLLASEVKIQDQTLRLRDQQGRPQWDVNGTQQQQRQPQQQMQQRQQQDRMQQDRNQQRQQEDRLQQQRN